MATITKTEEYIRIKSIQDCISKGFSDSSIRKFIEDKFGITSLPSQNKWIDKALKDLYKDSPRKAFTREINEQKIDEIYEKALSNDKLTDALKAIDMSNKINGLYVEKKEVKVENDGEIIIKFGE